jgi:hypothetical protein
VIGCGEKNAGKIELPAFVIVPQPTTYNLQPTTYNLQPTAFLTE